MERDPTGTGPVSNRIQDLSDVFTNTERVMAAIRQAVREALLDHKRAGNPVAIWRDGKSVVIPPEEIVVPDDDTDLRR